MYSGFNSISNILFKNTPIFLRFWSSSYSSIGYSPSPSKEQRNNDQLIVIIKGVSL